MTILAEIKKISKFAVKVEHLGPFTCFFWHSRTSLQGKGPIVHFSTSQATFMVCHQILKYLTILSYRVSTLISYFLTDCTLPEL